MARSGWRRRAAALGGTVLLAGLAAGAKAGAVQISILHSFGSYASEAQTNSDGGLPSAGLVQGSDGNLYGSTVRGGAGGAGTLFKMTPGGALTTLHSFAMLDGSTNDDGAQPFDELAEGADGNFYGVTLMGGANGAGTVFRVTPSGGFSLLHTFDFSDGPAPAGLARYSDGSFFGVTYRGGLTGTGSIFKITAQGEYTQLYSFAAPQCPPSGGPCTNVAGSSPETPLLFASDGNFYGTTLTGGASGAGTIFKTTPLGIVSAMHSFGEVTDPGNGEPTNADGYEPTSSLIEGLDGNLYGTTYRGGTGGCGTVFRITLDGEFSVLHTLDTATCHPVAGLLQRSDGLLYGVAFSNWSDAFSPLFTVTPQGAFASVQFPATGNLRPQFPSGTLLWTSDGTIYGTSRTGGQNDTGTIFAIGEGDLARPPATSGSSSGQSGGGAPSGLTLALLAYAYLSRKVMRPLVRS